MLATGKLCPRVRDATFTVVVYAASCYTWEMEHTDTTPLPTHPTFLKSQPSFPSEAGLLVNCSVETGDWNILDYGNLP